MFRITLHATTTRLFQPPEQSSEPQVVFLGDSKPISMNPLPSSHRRRTSINKSRANSVQEGDDKEENEVQAKQQQHLKRGQRGKLKKIKEKYKYQDEEERKLRMEILQVLSLCLILVVSAIDMVRIFHKMELLRVHVRGSLIK